MQGTYRILGGDHTLLESFVAAPGVAGWRYFGRLQREDTGEDVASVDYVVDREWNVVRFRDMRAGGDQAVALRGPDGLSVTVVEDGLERTEEMPEATSVWSRSPCSLLVADRRLRGGGQSQLFAVKLDPTFSPQATTIQIQHRRSRRIATATGTGMAEEVRFVVDGEVIDCLMRADVPLAAPGWFELIG